jgi:hypothetical protein
MKTKRFVVLALVMLALSAVFVSCAKKGTCDLCGKQNVALYEYKVLGQKAEICSDCKKNMKELEKNVKKAQKKINKLGDALKD